MYGRPGLGTQLIQDDGRVSGAGSTKGKAFLWTRLAESERATEGEPSCRAAHRGTLVMRERDRAKVIEQRRLDSDAGEIRVHKSRGDCDSKPIGNMAEAGW